MKTRILCPACKKAYLEYNKMGFTWFPGDLYPEGKNWRCETTYTLFHVSYLQSLIREGNGIDIDSVNYPKRLHITAEGVTAG